MCDTHLRILICLICLQILLFGLSLSRPDSRVYYSIWRGNRLSFLFWNLHSLSDRLIIRGVSRGINFANWMWIGVFDVWLVSISWNFWVIWLLFCLAVSSACYRSTWHVSLLISIEAISFCDRVLSIWNLRGLLFCEFGRL